MIPITRLTAHNWSILQNYDLANGATNWNLNPTTGSFMILLHAGSENRTITTADNLWFDNFKITDGNQTAPPVAPTITVHPIDRNATVGSNVSFTVEANGTDPLAYQWQKNGVNVNGATAATLTLYNVQLADDNSTYRAVVSNIAGSATSNSAILKVLDNNGTPPPIINSQPTHVTTSFDGNATFTVEANGTGLKYQWRVNGVDIPGADHNTLNLKPGGATIGGAKGANEFFKGRIDDLRVYNRDLNSSEISEFKNPNLKGRISAGDTHSHFIKSNGSLWAMGENGAAN